MDMDTYYKMDTLKQHERYKYINPYYKTIKISNTGNKLTQQHYDFMRSENIEQIYFNDSLDIIDFSQVPNCVYSLIIEDRCKYFDTALIPSSITHLFIKIPFNINALPSQIKLLDIQFLNTFYKWDSSSNLPPNLEYLRLSGRIKMPIDNLPQGLKYLEITNNIFYEKLDNLPPSLEYLELRCKHTDFLQNLTQLPESLTTLILDIEDAKYDKFTLSRLPINLKKLSLSSRYADLDVNFPDNLENLEIKTNRYNLASDIIPKLPANLKHIKLAKMIATDEDSTISDIHRYAPNAICKFINT